jgi:hypothetical protein
VGLFFSLANFFRFDPRAGLHLFWFITILSRSFIKIDERNGVWEHIKLVEKLAGKKKKIKKNKKTLMKTFSQQNNWW